MLIIFDPLVRRGLGALMRLAGVRAVPWIAVAIVLMLVQTGLSTIPVVAMIPLMSVISGGGTRSGAVGVLAGMLGTADPRVVIPVFALCIAVLFLVCSGAGVLLVWWQNGRSARLGVAANTAMLAAYSAEPYASHRRRSDAEILRNVGGTAIVGSSLTNVLTVYTSALTLVAICAVLLVASPLVTAFTVVLFGGTMALTQRRLQPAQRRAGAASTEANLRGWSFLLPLVHGFREVRLSGTRTRLLAEYEGSQARLLGANRLLATLGAVPAAVSQVVFALALAGVSAIMFATGSAAGTIATLGLFGAAAMRALPTMNLMTQNIGAVRAAESSMEILAAAVEDLGRGDAHVEEPLVAEPLHGDIRLEGVEFAYPDATEPVVHGIDLVIEEHATTAFVGSSGAGKSTVVDLVLGLLTPTRGTIACGGVPILADPARWYRGLAVVPQDVFLLNDTVQANIAFGLPEDEIDPERVQRALALARLDDVIAELPDGLRTVIGERGTRLSGGQRQRLGLARALYREPLVLVLDEATSALDNDTEAQIAASLATLHGRMTIIVVAHRLSTVRDVDKLVFLSAGNVRAEGTFAEVRDRVPEFARMVELGELGVDRR
ncbi:ABC transporter ATP-binding protein [Microbacterium sp. 22242]|uniref:ABC transporter ATP-binding protein n=1 Tax=Microbacterium sp. 22242 TaxID=3453896 RepID=UPI003F86A563